MGQGSSRTGRRAWLVGRIAALVAIAVAGVLAIVHYSSLGQSLAGRPDPIVLARTTGTSAAHIPPRSPGATPLQALAPGGATSTKPRSPAGHSPSSPPAAHSPSGPPARHASPSPSATPSSGAGPVPGTRPIRFRTLPPSAMLPTGGECARWVRESPQREDKAANQADNQVTGQRVGPHFFPAADRPQADGQLAPRISGNFTGSTPDILRWAACKWGISQNVVFAQAAAESWWQQGTLGDWGTRARACPPGHKLGADGQPGQCPQSYGILQNRYPYEKGSWPGIGDSTAMNADTAYAIWRSCYDGYETWLDNVPHARPYRKGDMWGCVGRWFAGRWHTPPAQQYIAQVKTYLHERIWLTRDFQQG